MSHNAEMARAAALDAPDLPLDPYYEDDLVTLFHGEVTPEVLADMEDRSVDCVITDPPYDDRTHKGAKTNRGKGHGVKAVHFDSFTHERQVEVFAELGRITDRWVVTTLATSTAFRFDLEPPPGLRCLRVGVWVKPNPMPQISADRPGQGWEPVCFFHREDTKPEWNGGGRAGVWIHPVVQGEGHPTVKPLPMVSDWVRLFTRPGGLVFDPFVGSGTTLLAAKQEGRRAIGVEREERYCEIAAKRLSQDTLFGDIA